MKHIFKKVLLSFALAAVLAFSAFAINIDLVEAEISKDALEFYINTSDATGNEYISIALYNKDGKMIRYYPLSQSLDNGIHLLNISNWDTCAVTAKIFSMADKTSMEPLIEPVIIDLWPAETSDRIIKGINLVKNSEGKYVLRYDVINPYAEQTDLQGQNETLYGTRVETYPSDYPSDSYKFGLGDVVRVYGGKIADDENDNGAISNISHATANLYWVLDMYDNGELLVGEIPEDGSEPVATYRVSVADATVLMIGRQVQSGTNMYRYTNGHVVGTLETLADNVNGTYNSYKAVSSSYWDENDKLVRAYGKYVKVYLNIDWENSDKTPNEDGVNGKAAYIVAVANSSEEFKYCDTENPVKA